MTTDPKYDAIDPKRKQMLALLAGHLAPLLDIKQQAKPQSHAWFGTQEKTIWFTLYRRAHCPIAGRETGEWIPVTRTHKANRRNILRIQQVMAARSELEKAAQIVEGMTPLAQRGVKELELVAA